ncbi:MAG: T9SS type A sorting domain-containing protein [Ignavibacteriales bacterium]|nr:T9SS type A sorting domain-containing protein [Ignavibacteriales bacterium]
MGVTLKIEGNYTLKDSLIIEDGGVLKLEPGSTLNLDSASSVYCAGDIYINGTESNKVTINFLQPNETKQNSIYLGRESSAIIKYAQIKNGYSGISALNGFDTLIIDNCNFTNISHAALLLNGAGYDKPLITNNTYTNCDYAGFFSNLSTVAVNSDSANTTSGYYFSGIEYALPKEGIVSIKLYDITGRLVKQLVNEQKPTGRHKTTIESGNMASGIYIYSLRVNDISINKKLVVLK